jgi:dCMP deaminase
MSDKKKVPPRQTPARDDRYMGKAFWVLAASKDPSTQVGAVIVGANNRPISDGYNGPPEEFNDNELDWDRPAKYPYIMHAEINAIRHAEGRKMAGATMYITAAPCTACMLDIVAAKIKRVVYFPFQGGKGSMLADPKAWETTLDMAKRANIVLEEYKGNLNWMRDHMERLRQLGVFS